MKFAKVNATSSPGIYKMEYQAEVEFLKDGAWTKGGSADSHVFFQFSPQQVGGGATQGLMASIMGSQNVRKGERQTITDYFLFEKTEKGWKAEDDQVY